MRTQALIFGSQRGAEQKIVGSSQTGSIGQVGLVSESPHRGRRSRECTLAPGENVESARLKMYEASEVMKFGVPPLFAPSSGCRAPSRPVFSSHSYDVMRRKCRVNFRTFRTSEGSRGESSSHFEILFARSSRHTKPPRYTFVSFWSTSFATISPVRSFASL